MSFPTSTNHVTIKSELLLTGGLAGSDCNGNKIQLTNTYHSKSKSLKHRKRLEIYRTVDSPQIWPRRHSSKSHYESHFHHTHPLDEAHRKQFSVQLTHLRLRPGILRSSSSSEVGLLLLLIYVHKGVSLSPVVHSKVRSGASRMTSPPGHLTRLPEMA